MIFIESKLLKNVENSLESVPNEIPKVMARAMNRAMTSGRAKAVTKARQVYSIKARDLKKGVILVRATKNNLWAEARFRGSVEPFTKFRFKPQKRLRQRRRSQRSNVRALKIMIKDRKWSEMSRAFAIESKGKTLIGEHPPGQSKEINWLYGPSVPQMMGEDRVIKEFNRQAKETLVKRLDHEVKYVLGKGFSKL